MELSRLIMDEKSGIKEYLEFIEENFNINELDQFNRTLLQIAVVSQKWDIAADLISRGINVNNQDYNNNTVLHYLCEKPSNIEIIKLILESGGNPNIRNKHNISPLFSITGNRFNNMPMIKYQVMELLLKYGGDKLVPCAKGNTSEDVASLSNDNKAVELLKKYDAPQRYKKYPDNSYELQDFIEELFNDGKFVEVVDVVTAFPEEKRTKEMIDFLIVSMNNIGGAHKALDYLEFYKDKYDEKMRVWYYYATYAYVELKDYENGFECLEAGIKECDIEKERGKIGEKLYKSEIADFKKLRTKCTNLKKKAEKSKK